MASYSDDFNRANETPLASGTWGVSGTGSCNLASNAASHPTDANDNEHYFVAASALGDQFAQAKFVTSGGSSGETGCGVVCRHIGSTTRTFIRAVIDDLAITVRTFTAGASTLVGSRSHTFAANDVLRMEVTGTSPNIVVKVFINGVQQGANFTAVSGPNTGKPGLCYSSTTASAVTIDDWAAGDFAAVVIPDLTQAPMR